MAEAAQRVESTPDKPVDDSELEQETHPMLPDKVDDPEGAGDPDGDA